MRLAAVQPVVRVAARYPQAALPRGCEAGLSMASSLTFWTQITEGAGRALATEARATGMRRDAQQAGLGTRRSFESRTDKDKTQAPHQGKHSALVRGCVGGGHYSWGGGETQAGVAKIRRALWTARRVCGPDALRRSRTQVTWVTCHCDQRARLDSGDSVSACARGRLIIPPLSFTKPPAPRNVPSP